MVICGDEKYFIICFNNGGVLWMNWVFLMENCCYVSIDVWYVIV